MENEQESSIKRIQKQKRLINSRLKDNQIVGLKKAFCKLEFHNLGMRGKTLLI